MRLIIPVKFITGWVGSRTCRTAAAYGDPNEGRYFHLCLLFVTGRSGICVSSERSLFW